MSLADHYVVSAPPSGQTKTYTSLKKWLAEVCGTFQLSKNVLQVDFLLGVFGIYFQFKSPIISWYSVQNHTISTYTNTVGLNKGIIDKDINYTGGGGHTSSLSSCETLQSGKPFCQSSPGSSVIPCLKQLSLWGDSTHTNTTQLNVSV